VSLTLTVRHGLPVNIHRGLDAGVAHQLLLDGERRASFIPPGPIAVPERVPSDIGRDAGFSNVRLLNFLLMVGSARHRIGEQPSLGRGERPFLV
jgi:hypothetical protein